MGKFVWIFLFILFSADSFAKRLTCLDKLLPFSRHSGLHHVTKDEWTDPKEVLDSDSAQKALNFLVRSKLMCDPSEVVTKITPVCLPVIVDIGQSNVCYVFTNLGYFFISKDGGRNINFIFSKDRTFSPPNP